MRIGHRMIVVVLIVLFFPALAVLTYQAIGNRTPGLQGQVLVLGPFALGEPPTATPTCTATATASPANTSTPTATSTPTPRSAWTIQGMPVIGQSHHLSCEYAATYAVTKSWGRPVTEADFIREIPIDPNPHVGFRGNIDGAWGGTDNYGIYAEPIASVLERKGFRAQVFYGPAERLRSEISLGHPVVIWYTGITGDFKRINLTNAGQQFYVVPYEHAVVVYGFDQLNVQIMDVGTGMFTTMGWSEFLRRWSLFDQMALVITSMDTPTPTRTVTPTATSTPKS